MKHEKVFFILLGALLVASTNLFAQTTFVMDGIKYEVTSTAPAKVQVMPNIPESVTNGGTTYSVMGIGN